MNGKLFSSITYVEFEHYIPRVRNVIIGEGYKENFIEIMEATAGLPFLVSKGFFCYLKGKRVLDGGLTNNIPLFLNSKRK